MKILKATFLAVAGLAGLAAIVTLGLAQHATLFIDADTPVLDRATTQLDERQIDTLHAGMQFPVTRCLDLKSERYFEISLPDGQGYVNSGKYHYRISYIWAFEGTGPVVFNCF